MLERYELLCNYVAQLQDKVAWHDDLECLVFQDHA